VLTLTATWEVATVVMEASENFLSAATDVVIHNGDRSLRFPRAADRNGDKI
jgi:hypothetical protein